MPFKTASPGKITSTDTIITANRPGEGIEAGLVLFPSVTLSPAALVFVFEDGAEESLDNTVVLDDGALMVKVNSASVFMICAALLTALLPASKHEQALLT